MDAVTPKTFWERPEGNTGMVIMVAIGLAIATGLYFFLPFIIVLLQNMIYASILGGVVFAMVVAISNPKLRNLVGHVYKSGCRMITQFFVEIDPIGILKNYVADLQKNLGKLDKQIENLQGQIRTLENEIKSNVKGIKSNIRLAEAAQKKQNSTQVKLQVRKAGRLKESNITFQEMLNKMISMSKVLKKMFEASEFMIDDMSHEVTIQEKKRKMILASHSAYKSAQAILKGDQSQKEMFDMAMDHLAQDYGQKVGEIERFMETSQNFIETMDLQNGIYEEDAFELLENFKVDDLLIEAKKPAAVVMA